jgi:hypothetical protein
MVSVEFRKFQCEWRRQGGFQKYNRSRIEKTQGLRMQEARIGRIQEAMRSHQS